MNSKKVWTGKLYPLEMPLQQASDEFKQAMIESIDRCIEVGPLDDARDMAASLAVLLSKGEVLIQTSHHVGPKMFRPNCPASIAFTLCGIH